MKQMEKNKVPEFQSLEEERAYWEASGPLVEDQKGKLSRPRHGQTRSSFLAVRLTGDELARLRDIAEKQGMGPSTFARAVLMEAVGRETLLSNRGTVHDLVEALEERLPRENRERFETFLRAFDAGAPSIHLTLTDKKELDEFAHLTAALFMSIVHAEVVVPQSEEHTKAKSTVKARS